MKQEYVITTEELQQKGVNLHELTIDDSAVQIVINLALDFCVTRILKMNDNLIGESDLVKELDKKPQLVSGFKKLQAQMVRNLVYKADDPNDKTIDDIITFDLHLSKINGFQKGIY